MVVFIGKEVEERAVECEAVVMWETTMW